MSNIDEMRIDKSHISVVSLHDEVDRINPLWFSILSGNFAGSVFLFSVSAYTRRLLDIDLPHLGSFLTGDTVDAGAISVVLADLLGFALFPLLACCITHQPTMKWSLLTVTFFYGWFVVGAAAENGIHEGVSTLLVAPIYVSFSMILCLPVFILRRYLALRKSAVCIQSSDDKRSWPPPPHRE